MQSAINFVEAIHQCLEKDPRYHPAAYELVRDALHAACSKFREGVDDKHVTGQELLEGFREHVTREFGPMSLIILEEWGILRGLDVGNIVYNLIDAGYFGKNEGDTLEDFDGGFSFTTAFTE
ncbi:MAG: Minf_1886 family protein, partial [Prosthecobacter sp.]